MADITPITVEVEDFVSGPRTEVKKLNDGFAAIRELQLAVGDLTTAQAANGTDSLSQVIVSGNMNGGVPAVGTFAAFVVPAPIV